MLLPLRWLLYAITGTPTEEERGQFGGKERKVRIRKTRPRVAQWSDATAPAFEPATVIECFGVTARPKVGFIAISTGAGVVGVFADPALGAVTLHAGARVTGLKALPRVGLAAVKADVALFDYEIAALMLG